MARITVEDCLDRMNNRFALVLLVSKRAKQLLKGDGCTLPNKNNKYIVNSLREVAAGHVYFEIDENMGSVEEQIQKDLTR
jgi:DNA-directed RNA polymerase subunit omega